MTQYRKKPVVITAITFDQLVAHGMANGGNVVNGMPWSFSYGGHPITHESDDCYIIPTLEGSMKMGRDDMLITGVKGEIYPCKRGIFEATYDQVPDAAVNEQTHNWRFSSSYGGQLCVECGAVKGSQRGGSKCQDPRVAAQVISHPIVRTGPDSLERENQSKANKGPRVTQADIEAEIVEETYFTAAEGRHGHSHKNHGFEYDEPEDSPLNLLTFCVLSLRNGFTVTGESACASPENFDAEIGRRIARENAINKVRPLLGFRLRDQLAQGVESLGGL